MVRLFQRVGEGLGKEGFAVAAEVVQLVVQFREIVGGAHDASIGVTVRDIEGVADFMDRHLDHPVKELFPGDRIPVGSQPEAAAGHDSRAPVHVCLSEYVREDRIGDIPFGDAEDLHPLCE